MIIRKTMILLAISALCFTACKKDAVEETSEEPEFEQVSKYVKKYKNGVVEFTNYPVDTTDIMARGYFNFEKMAFIGSDKVTTSEWDMVIDNGLTTVIYPNNGISSEETPWYQNTSRVMVNHVLKTFDSVDAVPADLLFGTDPNINISAIATDKTEPYLSNPTFWAYYNYDIDGAFTYITPFTNRTSIFKLNDGRYVKFQMINTYNNEPAKNAANSRTGYFSFRYFISAAGSTDIKTN